MEIENSIFKKNSMETFAGGSTKVETYKFCSVKSGKSVNIIVDLQVSLRNTGTIFTDPQRKLAHRSVQMLKESSTWVLIF